MLRALLTGLTTIAAAIALVVFWPQSFGGSTDYLVISGVSMEPTYHQGDLVLVRRDSSYEIGDIVAFRTDKGDVIHRIVGGNAQDGFLLQGDNNANLDEWTPTPESIIGEEFVHIAGLPARVLSWPQRIPAPAITGAGAALLLLGFDQHRRRHRKNRVVRRSDSSTDRPAPVLTSKVNTTMFRDLSTTHRLGLVLTILAALSAVALVPATLHAWRTPTTTSAGAPTPVVHTLSLAISAEADQRTVVYPEGRVGPITAVDPASADAAAGEAGGGVPADAPGLFRRLLDEVTVTASYAGAVTEGVLTADVALRTGEGFVTDLGSLQPIPFTDGAASGDIDLDLARADAVVADAVAATGIQTTGYTITVTPRVAPSDGEMLEGDPLLLQVGTELITPSGTLQTTLDRTSASTAVERPTSTTILGVALEVSEARLIGLAGIATMLALATCLLFWILTDRPIDRFRLLHGSLLVHVGPESQDTGTPVRVASMTELVRLAKRDQRVILHQRFAHDAHRYFVPDGDLTYEFVVAPERPQLSAGRRDDQPDPTDGVLLAADDPRVTAGSTAATESAPAPAPNGPWSTIKVERFEILTRLWLKYGSDSSAVTRETADDGRTRYVLHHDTIRFEYIGEPADGPLQEALRDA